LPDKVARAETAPVEVVTYADRFRLPDLYYLLPFYPIKTWQLYSECFVAV